MATFLELCQDVAMESGTVSGAGLPSSVVGQVGRLRKIVSFTSKAWVLIQNAHDTWRWMRAEFSGDTTAGAARYTGASFNIDRLARWVVDQPGYLPVTLYLKATGQSDEGPIRHIPWEAWRARYDRGEHDQNRPTEYSISPANELCLGVTPDATYVVRGEYYKSAQVLAANTDEPELPVRFHDIIKFRALDLLNRHDEAPTQATYAADDFAAMYFDLMRDQLDTITVGGSPLA